MTDIGKNRGQPSRAAVMRKESLPARARDDLKLAFAGDQNRGPARKKKKNSGQNDHSTKVKSRMTPKSRSREIIR